MTRTKRDPFTGDLFAEQLEVDRGAEVKWPDASRVPLNHPPGYTVERALRRELETEANATVVAGYASLPEIVNLVASRADSKSARATRILLGHEPFRREHERFRRVHTRFGKEMENYWLERGFSLRLSAPLIKCIEALESGAAKVRSWPDNQRGMLHAKGYLTGASATFGSSNFTRAGLSLNAELNGRFTKALDGERYRETEQVIENYWQMGCDFSQDLLSLLHSLLRLVTWREALARACAELLEGDWAGRFLGGRMLPEEVHLWPSQSQGIAQALYILARQGSVLIADATGSGKTRLGVHLIRAVLNQITASGRYRRGLVAMICPPAVAEAWRHEARIADVPLEVMSHGILSHAGSARGDSKVLDLMRRAQVVCVDEGHNFFNPQSKRTQGILQNMCDHCIVFTATPINRGVSDLVHVADLLGADNLDDEVVSALELLSKTGVNILGPMHVFGQDHAPHGHMHIKLEDVRVPEENILLGEGRGFEISQLRLGPGRIHHCMRSIGQAERALDLMIKRAMSREAFGKPIIQLGKNLEVVSRARIEIEAMRLMVLRAARAMDLLGSREARVWVHMVKAMIPERVCQIIDQAIQMHGATGVSQWTPLADMYAGQRTLRLADGPDEVHHLVVGRHEISKYQGEV